MLVFVGFTSLSIIPSESLHVAANGKFKSFLMTE